MVFATNQLTLGALLGDEPPRVYRRFHFLRGWSYEQVYEIFAGSPRDRLRDAYDD